MSDGGEHTTTMLHATTMLDAWRGQQAERMDPIRFRFIQALASRANEQDGEVRCLLDARLSMLVDAYAADLESSRANGTTIDKPAPATSEGRGVLGQLADQIAVSTSSNETSTKIPVAPEAVAPQGIPFPDMPVLDEFQKLWATLRSESQLQQSLEQVNSDAGPLNSGTLVHRAILVMREVAPGYLQHFLSYVDTLSWMEKMQDDGVLARSGKPMTVAGARPSRSKPGRRRG